MHSDEIFELLKEKKSELRKISGEIANLSSQLSRGGLSDMNEGTSPYSPQQRVIYSVLDSLYRDINHMACSTVDRASQVIARTLDTIPDA